jgi:hypothetical protein
LRDCERLSLSNVSFMFRSEICRVHLYFTDLARVNDVLRVFHIPNDFHAGQFNFMAKLSIFDTDSDTNVIAGVETLLVGE